MKIFKNTKRVFALILAFAVIAMSMFTGVVVNAVCTDGTVDLLEFGAYLTEGGSTSNYYDTNVADNGETGDSWENAIIIDSAEELVYLCKASGNETAGKYYKVADGIAGFNLANANLDVNGTLADNLDTIKNAGKNHSGNLPGFQGHFDGNGATVYGAHVNAAPSYIGLFSNTYGEVTIKNINVNKAYFVGKYAAGGIIGYHKADTMCTVTIENCSVTDSYIETQGTGYGHGVGAILGYGASAPSWKEADKGVDGNGDGDTVDTIYVNVAYNIKNCYVNLDEDNFISSAEDGTEASGERVCHGGVTGVLGSNALKVSDCVVIGIKPYATSESTTANDVQHSGLESHFTNVYTTSDVAITGVNLAGTTAMSNRNFTNKIFPLADNQLKGAAAVENMDLDWSVWMADADGYPELAVTHKNISTVSNDNGTHSDVCGCGFGGIAIDCTYVDGECAVCGFDVTCGTRQTIYWDGTVASGIETGSGEKNDPYIIKTAAEFAYVVKTGKASNTAGKYYKIDDGIGTIVLQPKDKAEAIIGLKDAAAVKAYFESETGLVEWIEIGWEGSCFAGNFDGNGTTVYGLYSVSASNAGLFSTVDAGAAIHNIALKNSYLTSTATNYQVGGLAAVTSTTTSTSYDATHKVGAIWFDGCVVANNYMYNPSTSGDRSGVLVGASGDIVYVDNCLVYGNDATYGDAVTMPIVSSANNSTIVTDSLVAPEDLVLENDGAETPRYRNMVRNSVIFGAKPYDLSTCIGSRFNDPNCYTNVLTDADIATDLFPVIKDNAPTGEYVTMNVTDEQIKTVTLADLATAELGDAWINTDGYPELASYHDELNIVDNGDGTHGAACDCGFIAKKANHTYNAETGFCTVCSAECFHGFDVDEEKGALEFVVTVEGDCTTPAKGVLKCSICGITDPTEIEDPAGAPGHTHGEAVKENEVAPTFTTDGSYDMVSYCTVCGEVAAKETITVPHYECGDVNADGEINNKDLGLLMQYINGWNVEIALEGADFNADDKVNNKDYVLIMRFINDWEA